jgi:hypothetical protein
MDVINYANPINSCCDGPERGYKTWVHEQGLKTNQGPSAAKTLMTHSLNKEASQLLCDAMQCPECRLEDEDAAAEDWTDSNGDSLRPDRIWKSGLENPGLVAADEYGDRAQYMGAGQSK